VFALDAVASVEYAQIEAHLADCPRCRAELDAHREVAAALGNSVEPLPEGLWESIAGRLPARHDEEPPPMPQLWRDVQHEDGGTTALPRRVRPGRGPMVALASLAAAAAAAAIVLGVNLAHADNQAADAPGTAAAALTTPGHTVVNLVGTDHQKLAEFVVVPGGQGYLVRSSLPTLAPSKTYQLWGVVGGHTISLGILGQSPQKSTFTLAGKLHPSVLAITVEPAGGALVPARPMVAQGTV
jgi:anti-sigma factor RsiW